MTYLPRLADDLLEFRLRAKGAVLVEGAKWCGKTTTARKAAQSTISMDQPDSARQYRQLAETAPSLLLEGATPRLIDEWQVAPSLWNAVRFEVDQRGTVGQFILTGSAVPIELGPHTHSGIGRISRLKMRPMSLYESKESSGDISLSALFEGEFQAGANQTSLEHISFLMSRGGWPQAVTMTDQRAALFQACDYIEAVVASDISRVDGVTRNRNQARRLLRSYARNCATEASLETIRHDMLANASETFDPKTLYSYLDALRKIFVIEDAPAWNPNLRSKAAIRKTDTRYFTDPSLAVASLGIGPQDLIDDLNLMGLIFENLCVRDLRIYADSLSGQAFHFRDKSGLECDCVIHLPNGAYGLIEIKLGGDSRIDQGAQSLLKLQERIDTEKMKKPSFLMVLCAVTPFAFQRPDGVYVVPITSLGP